MKVQLSDAKLDFKRSKDSLTSNIAEKEKILNCQQTLIEELLKKLEALEQKLLQREENLSLKNANSDKRLDCSKLEKENEVLVETGKDQSRASEEILKTVEALKIKIDDILIKEDEDRNKIKICKMRLLI